jgi:hypothetical protein
MHQVSISEPGNTRNPSNHHNCSERSDKSSKCGKRALMQRIDYFSMQQQHDVVIQAVADGGKRYPS